MLRFNGTMIPHLKWLQCKAEKKIDQCTTCLSVQLFCFGSLVCLGQSNHIDVAWPGIQSSFVPCMPHSETQSQHLYNYSIMPCVHACAISFGARPGNRSKGTPHDNSKFALLALSAKGEDRHVLPPAILHFAEVISGQLNLYCLSISSGHGRVLRQQDHVWKSLWHQTNIGSAAINRGLPKNTAWEYTSNRLLLRM